MPETTALNEARFKEIGYGLWAFMRGMNRLKDFRNYYRKAQALGLTVEELDAFVARLDAAEAERQDRQAELVAKLPRCPHHPGRPEALKIVPDPDGQGVALVCPRCRYSRFVGGLSPQEYLQRRGIAPHGGENGQA